VAALEATLRLHWEGSFEEIPLWNYMARPADEVRAMAEQIASAYHGEASVEEGKTEVGGGSLPGGELRTFRVGLRHPKPVELARVLRKGTPPIAGRIEENAVWLDPRTLDQEELPAVLEAVRKLDDRAG
jgi:L-seryl-tRNA(Ser) seleniumtransferase